MTSVLLSMDKDEDTTNMAAEDTNYNDALRSLLFANEANGAYIHIDRSDQYDSMETFGLLVGFLLLLGISQYASFSKSKQAIRGWITFTCGIVMVLWSYWLRWIFYGLPTMDVEYDSNNVYYFGIRRTLPVEPIIFLVALAVFKFVCYEYFVLPCSSFFSWSQQHRPLSHARRAVDDDASLSMLLKKFGLSIVASPIVSQNVYLSLSLDQQDTEQAEEHPDHDWMPVLVQQVGSTLGSSLTVNGSVHGLLIASYFAYDNISWLEYLKNMTLPIALIAVFSVILIVAAASCCGPERVLTRNGGGSAMTKGSYQGLSTSIMEEEENGQQGQEQVDDENPFSKTATRTAADGKVIASFEMEDSFGGDNDANYIEVVELLPQNALLSPSSPPEESVLLLILALALCMLLLGYAIGLDIPAVTVPVVLILFWSGRHFSGRRFVGDDRMRLDLQPVLSYIGLSLMALVVNDPCIACKLWHYSLGGTCENDLSNDNSNGNFCAYYHALFQYLLALVTTPIVASHLLAGTCPYASPMFWIRTCFALSMAGMARSFMESTWSLCQGTSANIGSRRRSVCLGIIGAIPLTFMFVLGGIRVLTWLSLSRECSIKLGECYY